MKLAIIIPSRSTKRPDGSPGPDELFLAPTVKDLLDQSRGDTTVYVGLDGYWPDD